MPIYDPEFLLRIPKWVREPWWVIAYLVPPELAHHFEEIVQIPPDERFNSFVRETVTALIKDKRMPPDEIATPILNMADDVLAGRKITIRTGDYIAIQNFIRR